MAGIVGMGTAAEIAKVEMEGEAKRLSFIRDDMISRILEASLTLS